PETLKRLVFGLPIYSPIPNPSGLLVTCTLVAADSELLFSRPLMVPSTRSKFGALLNEKWDVRALTEEDQKVTPSTATVAANVSEILRAAAMRTYFFMDSLRVVGAVLHRSRQRHLVGPTLLFIISWQPIFQPAKAANQSAALT